MCGRYAAAKDPAALVEEFEVVSAPEEELRADYNEVQFILRYEGDGAPVREEAFARLKLKS
jgi:putative SOS response-associated peptidase YedK